MITKEFFSFTAGRRCAGVLRAAGFRGVAGRLAVAAAVLGLMSGVTGCTSGSSDTLAKVGTDTITQKQFQDFVISSGQGVPVLNYLITESVILQEAKAQGVLPSDADVSKELADRQAANPELAKAVADHRDQYLKNTRLELAVANLLKKGVDMSPAKEQDWFKSHHTLFDEPAKASINAVYFDDAQKAQQGQQLLAKGDSPDQVASSLGAKYYLSGKASPVETKEELQMQYGPSLSKNIDDLFNQKAGYTTQPISNITVPGITGNKVVIIRLVSLTPPKSAGFEASQKKVEDDMSMEAYAKKNLPFPLPPNMTAQQFDQLKRVAEPKFVQDLIQSYAKNNKITINNADLRDPIMKQLQPQPAAGAPGAAGGPAGAGAGAAGASAAGASAAGASAPPAGASAPPPPPPPPAAQ